MQKHECQQPRGREEENNAIPNLLGCKWDVCQPLKQLRWPARRLTVVNTLGIVLGGRAARGSMSLRPGTRKPSNILDGEQDQFLIPDVNDCKIARPVSHIEAMIRSDIQLCSVPWGTMTRSPAWTIFSSPAMMALHLP
jgi:hypothetical protein